MAAWHEASNDSKVELSSEGASPTPKYRYKGWVPWKKIAIPDERQLLRIPMEEAMEIWLDVLCNNAIADAMNNLEEQRWAISKKRIPHGTRAQSYHKTILCQYPTARECPHHDKCKLAHGLGELRRPIAPPLSVEEIKHREAKNWKKRQARLSHEAKLGGKEQQEEYENDKKPLHPVSEYGGEKSGEKIRQTEHASHHEVRREGLAQFSSVGNGIDDTFKTCSEVANEMLHDSNSFKLQIHRRKDSLSTSGRELFSDAFSLFSVAPSDMNTFTSPQDKLQAENPVLASPNSPAKTIKVDWRVIGPKNQGSKR